MALSSVSWLSLLPVPTTAERCSQTVGSERRWEGRWQGTLVLTRWNRIDPKGTAALATRPLKDSGNREKRRETKERMNEGQSKREQVEAGFMRTRL